MKKTPKIQGEVIEVADWNADAEFAVFPQGARAKDAVFAPAHGPHDSILLPEWRYLFKRSKGSYPDQFWGEIIAYRIGCELGLEVPPAFAAVNSTTGHCAALIEWFYDDSIERFVLAGDFLTKLFPEFDRDRGTRHNLVENSALIRTLSAGNSVSFDTNWRQWWVDALLFDALIGNTDRHQDNWGFVFRSDASVTHIRLAPLFDNGTSLGHERFTDRTASWGPEEILKYCAKGKHQAKWSTKDDPPVKQHVELLHRAVSEWSDARELLQARLAISFDQLVNCVSDLPSLQMPVPLTEDRLAFILRLLSQRLNTLKYAFQ